MSFYKTLEDLEKFRMELENGMVAIVVNTGQEMFCYGDLKSKHSGHDIECLKTGAKILYPDAEIMEIFKN